jgi:hypothetical protein
MPHQFPPHRIVAFLQISKSLEYLDETAIDHLSVYAKCLQTNKL